MAKSRLDAVVTVADAKWLAARLKDAPEAKSQIAFADVIVLNKTDLVTHPKNLPMVEARIRASIRTRRCTRRRSAEVPLDAVLGRNAFDLDRILELEPAFLGARTITIALATPAAIESHDAWPCSRARSWPQVHHGHESHKAWHITTMRMIDHGHNHEPMPRRSRPRTRSAFARRRPEALPRRGHALARPHDRRGDVDPEKFLPWIQDYVQREGGDILRSKGILAFKDEPRRFVYQGVHMMMDGDLQREWKPRRSGRAASSSSAAS